MRRVAILGSTGSVGENALQLLAERGDRFQVVLLAARGSAARLWQQGQDFPHALLCLGDAATAPEPLQRSPRLRAGGDALLPALAEARPDVVLNAITGAAGLPGSAWTVGAGKVLALANKESMVMAGPYLAGLARQTGATILPVDSEHCAIFQCLQGNRLADVRRVWLTASGGPFRDLPQDRFAAVTREEALAHPTWKMGERITIGSATLMNKAFEVVEAHWLFGLRPDQIQILVHRQSIVHSMVEFVDGSILAQMGVPDMRVPILYCLGWPERLPFQFEPFDPMRWKTLSFEPVDLLRFPAARLGHRVLELGGDAGAVLNAADEVATAAFLRGQVPFPAITAAVTQVLEQHHAREIPSLEHVYAADQSARKNAMECLAWIPHSC